MSLRFVFLEWGGRYPCVCERFPSAKNGRKVVELVESQTMARKQIIKVILGVAS